MRFKVTWTSNKIRGIQNTFVTAGTERGARERVLNIHEGLFGYNDHDYAFTIIKIEKLED